MRLAALRDRPCDCVVLDLRLPDMSGFEVLERMRADDALTDVPVVVFTGRELSAEEDAQLHTMARSIVVKGVESPERLLNETALFLHRIITDLPAEKQQMLERLNSSDEDLVGRTVLLVDDDARNIFALSSVLERRGMNVLTATTGNEAIELIEKTPSLAIVLMDIMMPEMDGYQTMEKIRQNRAYRRLPGLYDVAVLTTSVDAKTEGVQGRFDARGVSFANALLLASHYLQGFAWKRSP